MSDHRAKEQEGECDPSTPMVRVLETIMGFTAAIVMAYYYHSKGYIDLLRQIAGALFG